MLIVDPRLVLTEDLAYTIMRRQKCEIRRGYHIRL